VNPRYPVYIPSAGRADVCLTAKALLRDAVPFLLVVQPREREDYARRFGAERVVCLPRDNDPGAKDGLLRARNWIRDHAEASGAAKHWQLDDNISGFWRRWKARKVPCEAGLALRVAEDLTDRYENVGISGLNYYMFAPNRSRVPPFFVNAHVYSCTLVNHAAPFRWRFEYNDDADLCLQVLAGGWCTILVNVFLAWKMTTMTVKGGNTEALYSGDGRLKMARSLERAWPGVVKTSRRYGRPQHVIRDAWKGFRTPLILKPGVDLSKLPAVDEYGAELVERKTPKHPAIRALVEEHRREKT
jgi:hypothetical protein